MRNPDSKISGQVLGDYLCRLISIITVLLAGGFKYVLFSPRKLGKISNLTNIFQMGWFNHQLDYLFIFASWSITEKINSFSDPFGLPFFVAVVAFPPKKGSFELCSKHVAFVSFQKFPG